jgi:hypothetical protein
LREVRFAPGHQGQIEAGFGTTESVKAAAINSISLIWLKDLGIGRGVCGVLTCIFCMEKRSKTLALCASRPHIVAVR